MVVHRSTAARSHSSVQAPQPQQQAVQPGESDEFSNFTHELLDSVKQLKEGHVGPFSMIMSRALAQQSVDSGGVRKVESLPNVHFAEGQVIGSILECLFDAIPTERQCTSCIKSEQGKNGSEGGIPIKLTAPDGGDVELGPKGEDTANVHGNLKSGMTWKPDEAGIKKVVQYAHEKLDPVHIKSRVFSDLSFHFLVAGELELILQSELQSEERAARLHFLRTLCYHKEYLRVQDLKDQYDATLKNIERGLHNWSEYLFLDGQLHLNLTFRATVNARQAEASGSKVVAEPKENKKELVGKEPTAGKVVYCGDFNKKTCPFEDHHQGVFNKKHVTKWHICSKCLLMEGNPKQSHPASECKFA